MTTTTKTAGGEGQSAQKCIMYSTIVQQECIGYNKNIQWPIFMCL